MLVHIRLTAVVPIHYSFRIAILLARDQYNAAFSIWLRLIPLYQSHISAYLMLICASLLALPALLEYVFHLLLLLPFADGGGDGAAAPLSWSHNHSFVCLGAFTTQL